TGPISRGWWQAAHFSNRIGAMSLENETRDCARAGAAAPSVASATINETTAGAVIGRPSWQQCIARRRLLHGRDRPHPDKLEFLDPPVDGLERRDFRGVQVA